MRLPFFGFHPRLGPIHLRLPQEIDGLLAVYFQAREGQLPDPSDLKALALAWLERHAGPRENMLLTEWLERGLVDFGVSEKDEPPGPPLELLRHFGISPEESERFEQSTHVAMLLSHYNMALLAPGIWAALACARAIAEAFDGVVFDPHYPGFLPLERYDEDVPELSSLSVGQHIAVPASVDRRGLGWMTTSGMRKFGLPNLELNGVPPDLPDGLLPVINAAAQVLVEQAVESVRFHGGDLKDLLVGPELRVGLPEISRAFEADAPEPEEGVRGWTTIRVRWGKRRWKTERFLELVPPAHYPAGQGEWLHSILGDLLKTERNVRALPADHRAIQRAHARARAELPRVKSRFQAGLQVGETLHIKHGFSLVSGGHEYMWVVVNSWAGDRIRGQLTSDPQFRLDLRAGQPIDLRDSEVFDWLLSSLDGQLEGGYTNLAASPDPNESDENEED
jgi:hypothetical protein